MSDQLIQRAAILLQQKKYKEAEMILGRLMTENPHDVDVMVLYAEALIQQDQYAKAMQVVNSAIGFFPDVPHLFYQKARILIHNDRQYNEAEQALQQAITLDPQQADYFALYALVKIDRKQFEEALELAETGLEADPENIHALNARSTALMKLGRKEESFNAIHGALRQDPHNAYTHANHGWGLLEKGSAKEALHHFTEALRIDPNLGLAQAGMMEALKARYFVYRIFLKYSFWMSNLTAKYQWGVTIGFFLIFKLVQWLARNSPSLEVYLVPVLMLWMAIALSTWIITPLSNLFLRLNRYGKHLLDRKEIVSSNLVGASLLVAVAGISVFLIAQQPNWLTLFFYGITMMIPLGSMLAPSRRASVLVAYTAATGLVGAAAIVTTFLTNNMGNLFSLIYVIGIFIYQWVANAMIIKQNNR